MPRRKIVLAANEYYHIYNRGALQAPLFFERELYRKFILRMYAVASEEKIAIIAYCLMPNHFHILIRVKSGGNVDRWMRRTCQPFSRMINGRYQRVGTIFQDRFQSIHVNSESYLLQVCRYIHANPVKAGLAKRASNWDFSDYKEWIGHGAPIQKRSPLASSKFPDAKRYEEFVGELLGKQSLKVRHYAAGLQQMHLLGE